MFIFKMAAKSIMRAQAVQISSYRALYATNVWKMLQFRQCCRVCCLDCFVQALLASGSFGSLITTFCLCRISQNQIHYSSAKNVPWGYWTAKLVAEQSAGVEYAFLHSSSGSSWVRSITNSILNSWNRGKEEWIPPAQPYQWAEKMFRERMGILWKLLGK